MGLYRVDAAQAVANLPGFDTVIDARSESEYALDHLPGAVNWPSLNDEQRHVVGTDYKQVSPFEARKRGAAMVARNIAAHIEREAMALPRTWKPLVYCWRGGQRSGALALVLGQIGFEVAVLDGGYQGFRRFVVGALETLPLDLDLRVICGKTGSGKSRLLQALRVAGAQVLDLEALASHRGSVLGPLPAEAQPSQKRFETLLWQALRDFDRTRPIFAESESRTVGRLRIPETLLERLRAAPCLHLEMPDEARVALLMEDYAHLRLDIPLLCERMHALREARGAVVVERWQAMAHAGQIEALVAALLSEHYDPSYQRSMSRHFAGFAAASVVPARNGSAPELADVAARVMALTPRS